ncbi:hypothetical protein BV25DRAFT_1919017 [Artomyces pyxidatus]|uniref:Uncharacterized protein n=1 Tax=Artomyces pyxidatus TaxID=48021 RepID=A0ACB8SQ24_9AGAM|nr:hypothetical protein BV25DRAFT_1919017 [Artomyces pyxidatus]
MSPFLTQQSVYGQQTSRASVLAENYGAQTTEQPIDFEIGIPSISAGSQSNPSDALQILANASHESLVRSGNIWYIQLLQEYNKANAALAALREAYSALLESHMAPTKLKVETDNSEAFDLSKPLNRHDYPGVRFWHKGDWSPTNGSRATKIESEGYVADKENNRMGFLEDEHGNIADLKTADAVRAHMREVFSVLLTRGIAPRTWMSPDGSTARMFYWEQMYLHFPDLRLCEGNWKANRIAMDNYPSWRASQAASSAKKDNHTPSKSSNGKRVRAPSVSSIPIAPVQPKAKRIRKADEPIICFPPSTPPQQSPNMDQIALPTHLRK